MACTKRSATAMRRNGWSTLSQNAGSGTGTASAIGRRFIWTRCRCSPLARFGLSTTGAWSVSSRRWNAGRHRSEKIASTTGPADTMIFAMLQLARWCWRRRRHTKRRCLSLALMDPSRRRIIWVRLAAIATPKRMVVSLDSPTVLPIRRRRRVSGQWPRLFQKNEHQRHLQTTREGPTK
jgi:hypothetical protein